MTSLDDHKPPAGSLNILHHNARSLVPKLTYYTSLPFVQNYDVISFGETWLRPAHPDSLVAIPNFTLYRCDRHCGRKSTGGGIAVYVRSTIEVEVLANLPSLPAGIDAVWLRITTGSGRRTIIGSIYSPPDMDKSALIQGLSLILDNAAFDNSEMVITGDLNINWNRASKSRDELIELADDHNLHQVLSGLSYVAASGNESLLDLGFVSRSLVINQSSILTVDPSISDHYATSMSLCLRKERAPKRLITTRNTRRALPFILHEGQVPQIGLLSQVRQLDCSTAQASLLEDWVLSVFDRHAPLKTIRVRPDSPRWLTPALKRLVASKKRFFKQVTKLGTRTDDNWAQYKKFRNYVHLELQQARKCYYSSKLSADSSSFYKQVNTLLGRKPTKTDVLKLEKGDGTVLDDPASVANHLNSFFTNLSTPNPTATPVKSSHLPLVGFSFRPVDETEVRTHLRKLDPKKCGGIQCVPASVYKCLEPTVVPALTAIINTSLSNSEFPEIYKHALVTPIFKKGTKTDPSNYRPISSLPILSKVVESVMNKQMHAYLASNSLLSAKQFGFRQGVSTEHMLLTICNNHLSQLDSRAPKYIAQLGLDVRKAFDTVDHELLSVKLTSYFHFSENAAMLLRSYLSNRLQTMRVNNHLSEALPIKKGVPQGSILGPLLFNLMVNDMLTTHSNILSYADDTILFDTSNTEERALALVEARFKRLQSWYIANGLSLCPEKTTCIVFCNRPSSVTSLTLDNHTIRIQPHIKLLGVWLDSKLSFSHHIHNTTSVARSTIYALRKIRPYLNTEQCKLIYTSIIRPKLEYCSSLFLTITKSLNTKLERAQNKAIRIICRAPPIFSINDARPLVDLPTLASRRSHTFSKRIKALYFSESTDSVLLILMSASTKSYQRSLRSHCNLSLPAANSKFGLQTFTYQAIKAIKTDLPPVQFYT